MFNDLERAVSLLERARPILEQLNAEALYLGVWPGTRSFDLLLDIDEALPAMRVVIGQATELGAECSPIYRGE